MYSNKKYKSENNLEFKVDNFLHKINSKNNSKKYFMIIIYKVTCIMIAGSIPSKLLSTDFL